MFLKRIVLQGFKSFADRMVLDFGRGMTAVVGPNGCGKSNISDAFLWVTGEQSAKNVRGDKMVDVIFAGTTKRKPLGFAEVTLTLSEVEHHGKAGYQEVEITRRLYRSGESEYKLNGQQVRLKDIHALLLDTGHRFANIGQGQVDRIVMSKPHERRVMFEEAAGIAKFRQKRKEASLKLEQMQSNLDRVCDIKKEVEVQVRVLEEQAKKAREFQSSKQRLEVLEKNALIYRWKTTFEQWRLLKEENSQLAHKIQNLKESIFDEEERRNELKMIIEKKEQEQAVAKEGLYSLKTKKDLIVQRVQRVKEDLHNVVQKQRSCHMKLSELESARVMSQDDFELKLKESEKFKVEKEHLEASFKEEEQQCLDLKEYVEELREKHLDMQEQRAHLQTQESHLNALVQQEQVRLESVENQFADLIDQQSVLNQMIDEVKKNTELKQKELELKKDWIERSRKELHKILEEQQNNEVVLEQLFSDQQKITKELTESLARQQVLENLKESKEGLSRGVKELLDACIATHHPLHGKIFPLYEHVFPKKGTEELVSRALGEFIEVLVVQTKKDFKLVWDFLIQENLPQIPLICLEDDQEGFKSLEGAIPVSAYVEETSILKRWNSRIWIVEDLQSVIQEKKHHGKDAFVSRFEGRLSHSGISYIGRSVSDHVFMREAELQDVTLKSKILQKDLFDLELRLGQHQEKKIELKESVMRLDGQLRQEEMKLVEVNFSLQAFGVDLEKNQESYKKIALKISDLEQHAFPQRELVEKQQHQHRLLKQELANLVAVCQQTHHQKQASEEKLNKQQESYYKHQTRLKELEQLLQGLENMAQIFAIKDQEVAKQKEQLSQELENLAEETEKFHELLENENERLQDVEDEIGQYLSQNKKEDDEVVFLKQRCAQAQALIEEKKQQLNDGNIQQRDFEVKIGHHQTLMESCRAQIEEKYHLTLAQLQDHVIDLEQGIDFIDKEIKRLRKLIDNAQDINMASIEEFEKQNSRYQFLHTQVEDLNTSKGELEELIQQLDDESRQKFQETFEVVRENFRKNFTILFSGGEADLKCTLHDDPLETGIEIIAQPPGKQMRSMSLLSGGEKCMTAMALLFSLFEVKPAPFCLLDEIDAPLDDTNVQRFVNLLRAFIGKTQFLVITHNKGTMEAADTIFGVSMQERGVSRVLVMNFEEANKEEYSTVSVI